MIIYQEHYNTQIFDLEEEDGMKRGMAFVQTLLNDSTASNLRYNDIHVYIEEQSLIVSWTQVHYDNKYGDGTFQFVGSDEQIMKEIYFPDGHYEYVTSPEEEEERWEEWHKENPEWVQTSYGTWTNEEENKKWREEIESQTKKDNNSSACDWTISGTPIKFAGKKQ